MRTSFASSSAIAAQIRQGAAADVVVVADPVILASLAKEGLVERPATIARNAIAMLLPPGNPKKIRSLADLGRQGVRVAVAARGVPLGDYTAVVLKRAGAESILHNVVTEELEAAGVVGQVSLGEVDAGIGYASDLVSQRVEGFVLPDAVQVEARYEAAVVRASRRRAGARAYLEWLTGSEGRLALTVAGFAAP